MPQTGVAVERTVDEREARDASARPYVDGALLTVRRVSTLRGVHRGLDTVLGPVARIVFRSEGSDAFDLRHGGARNWHS
jgi:hypothetical protein